MARSTHIWVILRCGSPIAAFTVKHEMLSWLSRRSDQDDLQVWYLPDRDVPGFSKPPRDRTAEIVPIV